MVKLFQDRERDQRVRADREVFMKKSFDTITRQNTELENSINGYSKEIDDKVKDVRSLLINDQRIPKLEVSTFFWSIHHCT